MCHHCYHYSLWKLSFEDEVFPIIVITAHDFRGRASGPECERDRRRREGGRKEMIGGEKRERKVNQPSYTDRNKNET